MFGAACYVGHVACPHDMVVCMPSVVKGHRFTGTFYLGVLFCFVLFYSVLFCFLSSGSRRRRRTFARDSGRSQSRAGPRVGVLREGSVSRSHAASMQRRRRLSIVRSRKEATSETSIRAGLQQAGNNEEQTKTLKNTLACNLDSEDRWMYRGGRGGREVKCSSLAWW